MRAGKGSGADALDGAFIGKVRQINFESTLERDYD
jgi:hypothetical protein